MTHRARLLGFALLGSLLFACSPDEVPLSPTSSFGNTPAVTVAPAKPSAPPALRPSRHDAAN